MPLALLGWLLGAVAAPGGEPLHGLRILTEERSPAGTTQIIRYVADDRGRVEFLHPPALESASITRCDQHSSIYLDYTDRSFVQAARRDYPATAYRWAGLTRPYRPNSPTGPSEVIETKTTHTGERKTAFRLSARRVLTTTRRIKADGTVDDVTEADGWYVDVEIRPACERAAAADAVLLASVVTSDGSRVIPRISIKDIGERERGFPIEKTTTHRSSGHTLVTREVVRELTTGPLDPALFEVPPDFHDAQGVLGWLNAHAMLAWDAVTRLAQRLRR